jgi:hypothetical protein
MKSSPKTPQGDSGVSSLFSPIYDEYTGKVYTEDEKKGGSNGTTGFTFDFGSPAKEEGDFVYNYQAIINYLDSSVGVLGEGFI